MQPKNTPSLTPLNFHFQLWILFIAIYSLPRLLMGQTNESEIVRWLSKAELAPPFAAPTSLKAWMTRREEIRSRVWQLLGKLPPRPKGLQVQTLSHEERDGYVLEKFQFDNGAGSVVPGYLLLPKHASKRAPAVLYCH